MYTDFNLQSFMYCPTIPERLFRDKKHKKNVMVKNIYLAEGDKLYVCVYVSVGGLGRGVE